MHRLIASSLLSAVALLALILLRGRVVHAPPSRATPPTLIQNSSSPPAPSAAVASPVDANPSKPSAPQPTTVTTLAADLNASTHPPAEDVEILDTMLRQYLRRLRHRPVHPIGDDIDLARVLSGRNPMKAVILPRDHSAITADGHLRDRWGTPYRIHPRGYGAFEVRSAGPDRKLFTADDLVANPARGTLDRSVPDEAE